MSHSISDFLPNDQLPPRDEIEALCLKANLNGRGIALRKSSDGPIVAWVKYGPDVTIAEALTQDWVARVLAADPTTFVYAPRVFDAFTVSKTCFNIRFINIGFIVMEYVGLPDCDQSDSKLVAKAVQRLHGVEAPGSAPGHVDGSPAVHHFFSEWDSRIIYETVGELREHVNGVLKTAGYKERVNFGDKSRLCPSDINPGNFKKDANGKVFALDFRASCFLPSSFFSYALQMPVNDFAYMVARHIRDQSSDDVSAMALASGQFVLYGKNSIALPASMRKRIQP